MSQVHNHFDLSDRNTLALPAWAEQYAEPASESDLLALLDQHSGPVTVLGEGSNVVLSGTLPGLLLRPRMADINVVESDADSVCVEAGAGVHWDDLVSWCVDRGYHGLENLSWIPGSVGAAPFQNIGAYGVELADRFECLWACDLSEKGLKQFDRQQCQFGYRDSVFKSDQPGRWLITRIRLRLQRVFAPVLGYADLSERFASLPQQEQNAAGLRQLIIRIRDEKLPDPRRLPNAGSFFKNPEVDGAVWNQLKARYPDLVGYALNDDRYKLAAGWLIEQSGWKGRCLGPVGMHEKQALVLVNHGEASADEVLALQQAVELAVAERFGVSLEREPVLLAASDLAPE